MKCSVIGLVMLALCASGCPRRQVVLSLDSWRNPSQEELIKELKAASLWEDYDAVAKLILVLGLTAELTPEVWYAVVEAARTDGPVPFGVDWPDRFPNAWIDPAGERWLVISQSKDMKQLASSALSRMKRRPHDVQAMEEVEANDDRKNIALGLPCGWPSAWWTETDIAWGKCSEPACPPENSIHEPN